MKKFLITHNVCGEVRMDVVEVNVDVYTFEDFVEWINTCLSENLGFVILTSVSDGIKSEIAIRPQNIEAIMELSDKERMIKMNDELMQLVEPLIKYLKEKYDPHCKIEISSDAVRVIRTERQEMIELQS